uniref:Uncharacterized protein n=1 Tax=uncultured marine thaumarchaeote AD1000_100_C06 TaxID=1455887 RepID=A0A075FIK9_9ARCH|nr:hypothetical protein [uncultured marine thaumarchaeote AD1000_100_C06]
MKLRNEKYIDERFSKKNVNSKFTVVRLSVSGEKFEIFVDPDHALRYKKENPMSTKKQ